MAGIDLHLHQQIAALAKERYDTVIEVGGVGSGKTLGDAVWLLDRSLWDTEQWHCLAANTWPQIQAVTGEIYKRFDEVGLTYPEYRIFNSRPPREWVREWQAKGIRVPAMRDRYTNVLILRTGLHVYQATLLHQNYKQLRGWEFGSITVEEFTSGPTLAAVEFAMERVRCGIGSAACRERHRHTKYLKGNPPEDDGHWLYEWLARMDGYAATLPGGIESKHSDSYPNLLAGVGPVLYIPSSTRDNEAYLGAGYIDNQLARLDPDTANRRLNGVLTRKRQGRTYNGFDRANEWPIGYNRDRDLYLFFDFNANPTVAGCAHPLFAGEHPDQGPAAAREQHVGVFGEFFHVGGMDAYQLCLALASGEKGSGGYFPPEWKGLREHQGRVVVFGDATGGSKKKSFGGPNYWQIINGVLGDVCRDRYSVRVPSINPLVQVRTRSVNARFMSAAGFRTLWIDPNCSRLIGDLNTVANAPDGSIIKPGGPRSGSQVWLYTHISDALGYMIYELFPLGGDRQAESAVIKQRPRFQVPDF